MLISYVQRSPFQYLKYSFVRYSEFVPQKHRAPLKRSLTCLTHIESKSKSVVGEIGGGGPWGFGQMLLRGVLEVGRKPRGDPLFSCNFFLRSNF